MAYQVNGSRVEWKPTAARLRELTEEMPNATLTEFGNVNVKARVDSRSTRSTYIVDDSTNSRGQTITRAEYDRVAAIQDAHIAKSHMVVVDGYIGSDPQFRTRARLIMEAANANVAGMQKQLYYPAEADYDPAAWAPARARSGVLPDRRERPRAPYAARSGECTRPGGNECRPGGRYPKVVAGAGRHGSGGGARGARLTRAPAAGDKARKVLGWRLGKRAQTAAGSGGRSAFRGLWFRPMV